MVTELTMQNIVNGIPAEDDDILVLMYYGPTCGPCKATMPNYEDAAKFYAEKTTHIKCYKINAWEPVEQLEYCKNTWKVEGVPHFKAFCRGQEITQKVGGGDVNTMKEFIHSTVDEVFKRFGVKV